MPPPGPRALGRLPASRCSLAVAGAVVAGALAVWQPLVGLGLAIIAVIAVVLRDMPMSRLAPVLVVLTALAAVAGPNLAPPGAPASSCSGS